MKARSICHAGLTVSDFGAAVRWYHDTFGFLLVSEDELGPDRTAELFPLYGVEGARVRMGFMRAPGGSVLEIFEFSPKAERRDPTWNAPGFTHLAMNVSGVAAWYERLKAAGESFVTPPQRTGSVDWAFMRDPDGNLVELIDLKALRPAIRLVGGALGAVMKRGKFAERYR
ncbi:MAG TPA: VOC family protein [Spirochaetia bacterium]|nr:VOC family protein [Spirochaetales bacterium]HRW24171.1 VOC family protein [Spirochaetia bacterium]